LTTAEKQIKANTKIKTKENTIRYRKTSNKREKQFDNKKLIPASKIQS
jgi:hypothetical protein